eukprot:GHVP01059700.1.p1 GENE.GHVP01059700.1~~GHVP01059700.1.p1  ORF type:complete len:771 (-),score=97.81 GHVP01059700.1:3766-6078(-)
MKQKPKDLIRTFTAYQLCLICIIANGLYNIFRMKTYFLIVLPSSIVLHEPVGTIGMFTQDTIFYLISVLCTTLFSFVIVEPIRRISGLLLLPALFIFTFIITATKEVDRVRYRSASNAAFSLLVVNMLAGNSPVTDDEFGAFKPMSYLWVYLLGMVICISCNLLILPSTGTYDVKIRLKETLTVFTTISKDVSLLFLSLSNSETEDRRNEHLNAIEKIEKDISKVKKLISECRVLVDEAETEFSYSNFSFEDYSDFIDILRDVWINLELNMNAIRKLCLKRNVDCNSFLYMLYEKENIIYMNMRTIGNKIDIKGLSLLNTELIHKDSPIIKVFESNLVNQENMNIEQKSYIYMAFLNSDRRISQIGELYITARVFQRKKGIKMPFKGEKRPIRHRIVTQEVPKRSLMASIRYSFLLSSMITFMALFAIFPETRDSFMYYKGHWALMSIFVVMAPSVGEASSLGGWRIAGAMSGGIWATISWKICGCSFFLICFSTLLTLLSLYINYYRGYRALGRVSMTTYGVVLSRKIAEKTGDGKVIIPMWELALQRSVLISIGVVVSLWISVFVTFSFSGIEICEKIKKIHIEFVKLFFITVSECEKVSQKTQPHSRLVEKGKIEFVDIDKNISQCLGILTRLERERILFRGRESRNNYQDYLEGCKRLLLLLENSRIILRHINNSESILFSPNLENEKMKYNEELFNGFVKDIVDRLSSSYCSFGCGYVFDLLGYEKREDINTYLDRTGSIYFLFNSIVHELEILRCIERKIFPIF